MEWQEGEEEEEGIVEFGVERILVDRERSAFLRLWEVETFFWLEDSLSPLVTDWGSVVLRSLKRRVICELTELR